MVLELTPVFGPGRCPGCGGAVGRVAAPDPGLCAGCEGELRRPPPAEGPPGLERVDAPFLHAGPARRLIAALKYHGARFLVPWLAAAMAAAVAARSSPTSFDMVTWAPTSSARRRGRGYDQAELLARAVARNLGLPCRSTLTRAAVRPQSGLGAEERWRGPRFRAQTAVKGRVLLVDDVCTTGATLSAAATALRSAGADSVAGVTSSRSVAGLGISTYRLLKASSAGADTCERGAPHQATFPGPAARGP